MADPQLRSYVERLVRQGYDVVTIKTSLTRAGYSAAQASAAIKAVGVPRPRHIEAHKHMVFVVSIVLGIIVVGVVTSVVFLRGPSQLLDVMVNPTSLEIQQGDDLTFVREMVNLGSARRYDVTISYEIIDPSTNTVAASKKETLAISTRLSDTIRLDIPEDLKVGRYILSIEATYGRRSAEASFSFQVRQRKVEATCFDGLQNQGEEGVDCGGPCAACEPEEVATEAVFEAACPGGCDDFDQCTADACADGVCQQTIITPCCGNSVCEDGETVTTCRVDCGERAPAKSGEEVIADALNAFESDPELTKQLCGSLAKGADADECFSTIAEAADDYNFCDGVIDETKRDTCYMDFALSKNQFEVCPQLSNRYLKNSCFSLKNLRALQAQRV